MEREGRRVSVSPRRVAWLAAILLVLLAAATRPGRVAAKSLLLLPHLFPDSPVRPLAVLAPPPWRETLRYDYVAGRVEADIYHPGSGGPHGAVILELGARPLPRTDPLLVRFADSLARAGSVVMIPESEHLVAGRVLPEEQEAIIQAVDRLSAMPDVDAARLGLVGFSVGGGLAVLAATDPRLAGRIAFVNAIGAYFDARALLEEVATRSIVVDGQREAWQPSPLTLELLALQLIETLEQPAERALLASQFFQGQPVVLDQASLSPQARAVLRCLEGVDPAEMPLILETLPEAALARLQAISPISQLAHLHASLYVMHDLDDRYIPYSQSRRLVAAAPPSLRLYTEFSIFEHVVPGQDGASATFAADLAKLYRHLFSVGLEFL